MKILAVLGAALALWFTYVATVRNEGEHAYRLTIAIDTPEGVKSASSVVRVSIDTRPGLLPNTGGGSAVTGEAIFLDLGQGKNLVALLAPYSIVMQAFGTPRKALLPAEIGALSGKVELRRELVPTLLTFNDLNDPASAKVVYAVRWRDTPPQGVAPDYIDAFGAIFGRDYSLRSATIEIVPAGIWPLNRIGLTGEPLTRGVGAKLPWIGNYSFETIFERRLRESIGGNGSMMPGMNLRRMN